jgi:hypothetical protein
MKRHSFSTAAMCVCLLAVLLAGDLAAQTPLKKPFGFGFTLGEPTALTVKARVGRSSAIDIGIGKSRMGYPRIHFDYLWQFLNLTASPRYSPYGGVGLAAGFGNKGTSLLMAGQADSSHWYYTDKVTLAGRGVFGFSYFLQYSPIEFFGEINPLIGFIPEMAFDLEAAVGVRFYVKF